MGRWMTPFQFPAPFLIVESGPFAFKIMVLRQFSFFKSTYLSHFLFSSKFLTSISYSCFVLAMCWGLSPLSRFTLFLLLLVMISIKEMVRNSEIGVKTLSFGVFHIVLK